MPDFRILTFVTSADLYAEMRRSFEAGGFDDENAVYSVFDNTVSNTADPYTVVNTVLSTMPERYLIVCHQDVRLDDGASLAALREEIEWADSVHRNWAILGSAGLDMSYKQVLCVSDPWQAPKWPGPWPVEAEVLDELFLLIRPGAAELTRGLSGFHFYAADLCLSARRRGGVALVVNFPLLHLSNGEGGRLSPAYAVARDALQTALSPQYGFRLLVATTNESVILSRHRLLRRLARYRRVHRVLKSALGHRVVP